MATSRYTNDSRILGFTQLGTSNKIARIRYAIKVGSVGIKSIITMTGIERLDNLAGQVYGDSRYWWVLAAASDIGWGMQLPPGTIIYVPDLEAALSA